MQNMKQEVTPYGSGESKKSQVSDMFDNIAHRYDLLNRVLSLGIDQRWRKILNRKVQKVGARKILDIATGTGDVALMIANSNPQAEIVGLDISQNMLEYARQKAQARSLNQRVTFVHGDSENLPMPDNTFDAVTVAFGVRNFEDVMQGLRECHRVLHPGGTLFVLEFTRPKVIPFKQLYNAYFKYVLPLVGRLTSKDAKAYTYLFESVQVFPQREAFVKLLRESGFDTGKFKTLTFGICALYWSQKSP